MLYFMPSQDTMTMNPKTPSHLHYIHVPDQTPHLSHADCSAKQCSIAETIFLSSPAGSRDIILQTHARARATSTRVNPRCIQTIMDYFLLHAHSQIVSKSGTHIPKVNTIRQALFLKMTWCSPSGVVRDSQHFAWDGGDLRLVGVLEYLSWGLR